MKILFLLLLLPFVAKAQTADTTDTKKKTIELLESYRQRIIKGESFPKLAAMYSEDPGSASNGGMYKNVTKGMMVPEFENVAFSLKPGEISEIFETQYGFHFMQLMSRNGDELILRHILITAK